MRSGAAPGRRKSDDRFVDEGHRCSPHHAPVCLLTATILYASGGAGMNNSEAAGAVQVWAFVALAVGLLGMLRRLEASAPRSAVALQLLVIVGCAGGIGFGIDSMHAALTGGVNLLDTDGAFVPLGLAIPGALFPLAVAATGAALGRAGLIAGWSSVAIIAGGLMFPAARFPSIEGVAIAGDLILLVGLASVGLQVWSGGRDTARAGATPVGA
jgi:hypothetical protein